MAAAVLAAGCAGEAAPAPETTREAAPATTTTTAGEPAAATTTTSSPSDPAPAAPEGQNEATVGGDRPARLVLPPGWDAAGLPRPLVVLLHGYTASGRLQDVYLGVSATGSDLGYLTLTPDGTRDSFGNRFWNVTDLTTPVDDVGYLLALIDEVVADYNADPARVFVVGHSNGGFMANKLACEHPGRIAGIAAIAGGLFGSGDACSEPMRVLFIQGTSDGTVPYEGGVFFGSRILGAEATAARWREVGACADSTVREGPFDFDLLVAGEETTITVWDDCADGASVELWTMEGSGHIPGVLLDFRATLMQRLLATGPPVG